MERTPVSRLPDVQASAPAIQVSLSRAGVTNVEKVIRIGTAGAEQLYYDKLDCFVDLGPEQEGAQMSRFEEVVNDVIGEVVLGESGFKAEQLAQHVAEQVRERQGARRAETTIAARYPEHKPAPVSGIATQEIYTLYGSAVASERGTRRLVGVAAQGMTACPCAQGLVAGRARERLLSDGFSDDEIERILEAVPVATHNQRGLGTLHLGLPEACETDVDAAELLAIVEDSMSSEIYELMKRADEAAVVEKAHRRPRFVEDCVREAIRGAIERFEGMRDDAFVSSRQENLETIHQHNVVAERFGLLGELRREVRTGEHSEHHFSVREWLEGRAWVPFGSASRSFDVERPLLRGYNPAQGIDLREESQCPGGSPCVRSCSPSSRSGPRAGWRAPAPPPTSVRGGASRSVTRPARRRPASTTRRGAESRSRTTGASSRTRRRRAARTAAQASCPAARAGTASRSSGGTAPAASRSRSSSTASTWTHPCTSTASSPPPIPTATRAS